MIIEAEVVEDVWVVEGDRSPSRLFMQWDNAVPVIRDMLARGERVFLELAPVLNVIPCACEVGQVCDECHPGGSAF